MERTGAVSVTIVDRNYPPNKSVIAESASDLAKHLINEGFDVNVVHTDGDYQGGGADGKIVGNRYKVPSVYSGKQKILRLISSLIEGYFLINKARKISTGTIIVMTSPPLLNFWASVLLKKKKHPWIYWSMDVYPQAFLSAGLIKEDSAIYKYFYKKTYEYAPKALISLGDIQAKYLEGHYKKELPKAILPCGVFLNNQNGSAKHVEKPEWKKDDGKLYYGYIGNLGEAHSVSFLKQVIDSIHPEKHRLILVLYGSKAHIVKKYLKEVSNEGIVLLDFVQREQLKYIDVHLVSLEPTWVNLCVPSKMVSAVHNGSIFLFYGIKECDSWSYLQKAGWLVEKGDNESEQIKKYLKELTLEQVEEKKAEAKDMPELLHSNTVKAYADIVGLIKSKAR